MAIDLCIIFFSTENFQDAKSLLGKLEYQRGNVKGALCVFEGIDFQDAIQKLLPPSDEKPPPRKGRSRPGSMHAVVQQPAGPVLEALYLKAKCLQKLGRVTGIKLLRTSISFPLEYDYLL